MQKLKIECYTTLFEEERRKAEEDHTNVSIYVHIRNYVIYT